ncbi:MAG: hypothetical protein GWP91_17335 [Rhodobacterales bacterium]|nr:hypothetical protein [Rhodobacterales bacterium]
MGKSIGQEINLDFGYQVSEHFSLHTTAATIIPGAYYAIPVARAAGDALGSPNPASPWGLSAGMKVDF